jgi:hypothetical protein
MSTPEFDWDSLTSREGEFMEEVVTALSAHAWARPMLEALSGNGGIRRENKALRFELRFAHELMLAGVEARYEIPGEGLSTIDFGFATAGQPWAVELMRLEETQAVRKATTSRVDEDGVVWSGRILSTAAKDDRQSEEGETLKAVERICQKCERGGQPHKFRAPADALHMILVDFRSFLHGGDDHDRVHVALGGRCVGEHYRRFWKGKLISGVFDADTDLKGSREARERVHFLGFVNEKDYRAGGFAAALRLVANPHLFETAEQAKATIATWPLGPVTVLNAL